MKDFLKNVDSQLKDCEHKTAVMTELYDHIQTKKEYFEEIGYDSKASNEMAEDAMGDGEMIGERLNCIHSQKKRNERWFIFLIIISNIIFPFIIGIPRDKNTFIFPFFSASVLLVLNYIFTFFAIKIKKYLPSVFLLLNCIATMWLSVTKLTYPLCNILTDKSSIEYIYVSRLIGVAVIFSVIIPNLYNIFICRQIRLLKNTKKQNKIAKAFSRVCIVMSVITAVLAYPMFLVNESYCNEQIKIQKELVNFVLQIEDNFEYNETEELTDFLNNSKYDFTVDKSNNSEDDFVYKYTVGNWELQVYFYSEISERKGYSAGVTYYKSNCSNSYLFNSYAEENNLIDVLGGEDLTNADQNNCIGMTRQEIKSIMNEVGFAVFSYDCYEKSSHYCYEWLTPSFLYGFFGYSSYYFDFNDNSEICSNYDLMLD